MVFDQKSEEKMVGNAISIVGNGKVINGNAKFINVFEKLLMEMPKSFKKMPFPHLGYKTHPNPSPSSSSG